MKQTNALKDVIAERGRQIDKGHTLKVDADINKAGDLALAASAIAGQTGSIMNAPGDVVRGAGAPALWPWSTETYKWRGERQNLVVAAALLLAEIERLDEVDTSSQG